MQTAISFAATFLTATALSAFPGMAQKSKSIVTIIAHPVEDYAAWRALYDEVKPMRDAAGLISQRVLQAPDDPNMVILIHEFETLEGAQALFGSAELKAVMKDAGVLAPPVVTIGTDAE